MASAFDRLLGKWADENVAGRGRNALRFLGFVALSGVCVAGGVWISQSAGLARSVGEGVARAFAIVLLFGTLIPLGLALVCLMMSLMNVIRTGKLG